MTTLAGSSSPSGDPGWIVSGFIVSSFPPHQHTVPEWRLKDEKTQYLSLWPVNEDLPLYHRRLWREPCVCTRLGMRPVRPFRLLLHLAEVSGQHSRNKENVLRWKEHVEALSCSVAGGRGAREMPHRVRQKITCPTKAVGMNEVSCIVLGVILGTKRNVRSGTRFGRRAARSSELEP